MDTGERLEQARQKDATWRKERARQRKALKEGWATVLRVLKEWLVVITVSFVVGWVLWEVGWVAWTAFPDFWSGLVLIVSFWSWPWKLLVGLLLLTLACWGLEALAEHWNEQDDGQPH